MNKINYNAPVTLTFTIISVAVLILDYISGGRIAINLFALFPNFGIRNFIRMFTYVFAHLDFNHFFGNFSIILLIGPLIEEKYGEKNLLLMMVATAFVTALIHILFFNTIIVGASGIVFMLILLTPFTNTKSGKIPLTFILIALIYIGREIFLGITLADNVSRFGHVFGGIMGACSGFFLNRQKRETNSDNNFHNGSNFDPNHDPNINSNNNPNI